MSKDKKNYKKMYEVALDGYSRVTYKYLKASDGYSRAMDSNMKLRKENESLKKTIIDHHFPGGDVRKPRVTIDMIGSLAKPDIYICKTRKEAEEFGNKYKLDEGRKIRVKQYENTNPPPGFLKEREIDEGWTIMAIDDMEPDILTGDYEFESFKLDNQKINNWEKILYPILPYIFECLIDETYGFRYRKTPTKKTDEELAGDWVENHHTDGFDEMALMNDSIFIPRSYFKTLLSKAFIAGRKSKEAGE